MSGIPKRRKNEELFNSTTQFLLEMVGLQKENPGLGLQQFDNLISASQYLLLYNLVHTHLPRGCRILDWGCGNGHFSFYLIQNGYDVSIYSFDNLPPLLLRTDKSRYVFIQGDRNDPVSIPFAEQSFDAVVSVGVLEHVRETQGDEAASLAEIKRVLRSGGIFFGYHIPNAYSWIEAVSAFLPKKHSHQWRYKREGLNQILLNSGFRSLFIKRYGFLPRWLSNSYPIWIKNSSGAAGFYNQLDAGLGRILPLFCTNFAVIAQKIDKESKKHYNKFVEINFGEIL